MSNTYRAQNAAFAIGAAQRGHLAAQRVLWQSAQRPQDERELIRAAREELAGEPQALSAFDRWLITKRA